MQRIVVPPKNLLSDDQYNKEVDDKQKYIQEIDDAITKEQNLLDLDDESDSDDESLGGRAPGPGTDAEDGNVFVPFNVKIVHEKNLKRLNDLKESLNYNVPNIQTKERVFRTLAILQKGPERRQVWCDRDVPDDNDVLKYYHWQIQTKSQPWKPFFDTNGDIIRGRFLNPNTVHGRVRLVYSDGTNTVLSNIISLDNITRNLTAAAKRKTYKFNDGDVEFQKIVLDVWEKILKEINYPQGVNLAPIVPSRLEGPLSTRVFRDRIWGNKYTPSIFKRFSQTKQQLITLENAAQIIEIVQYIHPTIRLNSKAKQRTLRAIQSGRDLRLVIPPITGGDNNFNNSITNNRNGGRAVISNGVSFADAVRRNLVVQTADKSSKKRGAVSKQGGAASKQSGTASKKSVTTNQNLGMNSSYSLLRRLSGLDDLLGGNAVQRDTNSNLFYKFPKGVLFKLTPQTARKNTRYFVRYKDGFNEVIEVQRNGNIKFVAYIDIPSEATSADSRTAIQTACNGYYVKDAPFRTWDDDLLVAKYNTDGSVDEVASGNALLALINQNQSSGLLSNAASAVSSMTNAVKGFLGGSASNAPKSPPRRSSRLNAPPSPKNVPKPKAAAKPPPASKNVSKPKAPKPKAVAKPSSGASKVKSFSTANGFMTWAEKPAQRGTRGNLIAVKYTSNQGDVILVEPRKAGEVYVYVNGIGVIQFKNHATFRGNNGLQNDGPSMQKVGELPADFWSSRTWSVDKKGAPVDSEVAQIKAEFTAVATTIQIQKGGLPELSKDNMFETTEAVYDSEDMATAVRPDNAHLSTSESEEEVVPMMSSLQRSNARFSTSESEEDDVHLPTGDITKMMSTMPAEWSSTEDELDFAESSAGEEEEEEEKMVFAESSAAETLSETSEPPIMEEKIILSAEHSSSGVDFAESSAADTQSETSETPFFAESSAPEQTSSGVDFAESSAADTQSETSETPFFAESSAPEQTSSGVDFAESSAVDTQSETSETPFFAESSAPEQTSSGVDFAESSAPEHTSSGVDFAESSAAETLSETSETQVPILEEDSSDSMAFESFVNVQVPVKKLSENVEESSAPEVSGLDFAESSAAEKTSSDLDFAESSAAEKTSSDLDFAESSAAEKTSSDLDFAESSAAEKTSSDLDFAESSSPEMSGVDFAESSSAETETSDNEI